MAFLEAAAEVQLVARHPARPDTTVSMGDSVASGHGRDRADYLGGDVCWRAEDLAYGALVHQARGIDGGQSVLVACSGHGTSEVQTTPVGAGDDLPAAVGVLELPRVADRIADGVDELEGPDLNALVTSAKTILRCMVDISSQPPNR